NHQAVHRHQIRRHSTRRLILVVVFELVAVAALAAQSFAPSESANHAPVRVFMPDGQMKSHLLRVFITTDVTEADAPTLTLWASRLLVKELPDWAEKPISVREIAHFQQWTEIVDGHDVNRNGTLFIFDLRGADFPWFKASMRITPVIKWGKPPQTA